MGSFVVVPNWNGKNEIKDCLVSLRKQSLKPSIIVVDNGSIDGSVGFIEAKFPEIHIVKLAANRGFAGGVNAGIRYALQQGANFIALFNNDAVADKNWLRHLIERAKSDKKTGIVTGKFLNKDKAGRFDSTGDQYSIWGLPFPRGRGEKDRGQYDKSQLIFGATGGASIYRAELFEDIGLFDESFFAYYEDIDISFRAQLAGWKVAYEPKAVAYHRIGATSSKLGQFTRYHTLKNFYYLFLKNMPTRLFWRYLPRFIASANSLEFYNLKRRMFNSLFKAYFVLTINLPVILAKRIRIQRRRRVTVDYIDSILYHGIPPTQTSMLRLAKRLWRYK